MSIWKRKPILGTAMGLPILIPPTPPKRQFKNMSQMLAEAERWDYEGEKLISKNQLTELARYITEFINQESSEEHTD